MSIPAKQLLNGLHEINKVDYPGVPDNLESHALQRVCTVMEVLGSLDGAIEMGIAVEAGRGKELRHGSDHVVLMQRLLAYAPDAGLQARWLCARAARLRP